MANIDDIYRNLTGVDIDLQRRLWDERGKGYYGEYLVFKELYPRLPGCCKILMNLQIPTGDGRTTEIDLLLIHETGLYVFEVKHYKGTIYGKSTDQKWTQYFRTSSNSHFYNPILQNQYHIKSLQKRFPGVPVYSYIVFTSPECDLRVECNEAAITVCQLRNLHSSIRNLEARNQVFTPARMDCIFEELAAFSPMIQQPAPVEGNAVPFYQYIDTITKDFHDEKEKAKNVFLAEKQAEKRKTRITIFVAVLACIACVALSVFICSRYKDHADSQIAISEQKLSSFAQKFEHVEAYNNGAVSLQDDFITVSDVQLSNSIDFKDTVNLSFTLNWNGERCNATVRRDTNLIVLLKNGSVKEYSLNESTFPYANTGVHIGKGNVYYRGYTTYKIATQELYGLSIDDISYIKLSGLDIWVTGEGSYTPVVIGSGFEIKIY